MKLAPTGYEPMSESAVFAITATRYRDTHGCNAKGNGQRSKGGFLARRCRAKKSTNIRIARAVTSGQVAGHFATRGNVDLQSLRNQCTDTGFDTRRIDELVSTVHVLAHERAIGGRALRFARTF